MITDGPPAKVRLLMIDLVRLSTIVVPSSLLKIHWYDIISAVRQRQRERRPAGTS